MLILVSNDDGIDSDGIRSIAAALKKIGEVIVVAPLSEQSGASHSLTLHRPLRIKQHSPGWYSVDGTPTDCVMLGVRKILKERPDLIVSGINRGPNVGDDVHYSGTVAAAREGGILGIPSIAFSLAARENCHFNTAAQFAVRLIKKMLKEGLSQGLILNVNIPNLPPKEIKGYTFTKTGKRDYGEGIVKNVDPRGRDYYWIGGDQEGFQNIPETDCQAILEGKISITPLRVDTTDHAYLKKIQNWKI